MKLFTLFATLFSTCFAFGKNAETEFENYLKEIGKEFTQIAEKKHHLNCTYFGAISLYGANTFSIECICHTPMTIEQARQLDIEVISDIIIMTNKHKKSAQFFSRRPFSSYDISISYSFEKPTGGYLETGVSFVHHNIGTLLYKAEDPVTKKYTCLCEETFTEALTKVDELGKKQS